MTNKRSQSARTEATFIRLSRDEHSVAERAARLEERPLASFGRLALLERAKRVLSQVAPAGANP